MTDSKAPRGTPAPTPTPWFTPLTLTVFALGIGVVTIALGIYGGAMLGRLWNALPGNDWQYDPFQRTLYYGGTAVSIGAGTEAQDAALLVANNGTAPQVVLSDGLSRYGLQAASDGLRVVARTAASAPAAWKAVLGLHGTTGNVAVGGNASLALDALTLVGSTTAAASIGGGWTSLGGVTWVDEDSAAPLAAWQAVAQPGGTAAAGWMVATRSAADATLQGRLLVDAAGRVGINVPAGTALSADLQVNGRIVTRDVLTTSDRRLKRDVVAGDTAALFEAFCAVELVTYRLLEAADDSPVELGVVAQQVREVFPLAVREAADGTLSVDYFRLGLLSVGALQHKLAHPEARCP